MDRFIRETMREYRAEVKNLAEKLMEIMEENLGLEKGTFKNKFTGNGEHEPFFGTKVSIDRWTEERFY